MPVYFWFDQSTGWRSYHPDNQTTPPLQRYPAASRQWIFQYLKRYDSSADNSKDILSDLINRAVNYYTDHIEPNKQYRIPGKEECKLLKRIHDDLQNYEGDNEDEIQAIPFSVARDFDIPANDLFKMFYEVVLGQERGPRFGTFTRLLGKETVLDLIEKSYTNNWSFCDHFRVPFDFW